MLLSLNPSIPFDGVESDDSAQPRMGSVLARIGFAPQFVVAPSIVDDSATMRSLASVADYQRVFAGSEGRRLRVDTATAEIAGIRALLRKHDPAVKHLVQASMHSSAREPVAGSACATEQPEARFVAAQCGATGGTSGEVALATPLQRLHQACRDLWEEKRGSISAG